MVFGKSFRLFMLQFPYVRSEHLGWFNPKVLLFCAHAQSCPTPCAVARQAPLAMAFPRQEYWSELHFLLQGIFLTRGLNLGLPHCRQILYSLSHQARVKWTGFES